jgi:hypothetical protein
MHPEHHFIAVSSPVDSPEKIMALSINSQKSLKNDFAL